MVKKETTFFLSFYKSNKKSGSVPLLHYTNENVVVKIQNLIIGMNKLFLNVSQEVRRKIEN